MSVIIDIAFLIGGGTTYHYASSLYRKFRTDKTVTAIEDGSYGFQSFDGTSCPKCGITWQFGQITYCECDEHYNGHFHVICKGTDSAKKQKGCHFKWIMRTKS